MSRDVRADCPRGFTLLELLVVLAIIALATAAVTLSIRPNTERRLAHEALRLSELFQAARAQSQLQGSSAGWYPSAQGFVFTGLGAGEWPTRWLAEPAPQVQGTWPVVLGPEPIVPAQSLRLSYPASGNEPARTVEVFTDGLSPFRVRGEGS